MSLSFDQDTASLDPTHDRFSSLPVEEFLLFHRLLVDKKVRITKLANDTLSDEMGLSTDDLADLIDHAANEILKGFEFRLRTRERSLFNKINTALDKIDDGTYGECEECGDEIGHSRLLARPEAPLCIECKEDQERKEALHTE